MIRRLSVVSTLAAALCATAAVQAQPIPGQAAPPGPMAGAMPTGDYVRTAAQSDEFEIAEAKMAMARSHNPQVMAFARKMVHDHTQSTMMIKAALRESGHMVPPPPPLSPDQQRMMTELRDSGPNFDRTYVNQQVQAHEAALSVHQGYAGGGSDPALRRAANQIVPVVQTHLSMARDMQSRMG